MNCLLLRQKFMAAAAGALVGEKRAKALEGNIITSLTVCFLCVRTFF